MELDALLVKPTVEPAERLQRDQFLVGFHVPTPLGCVRPRHGDAFEEPDKADLASGIGA